MTLVYRDPNLLASTLTPLVDLAEKVVRLQRDLDAVGRSSPLRGTLRAAEDRIAEKIAEFLEVKVGATDPGQSEGDHFKVGDRVRIARKIDVLEWVDEMNATVGLEGEVYHIDASMTDAIPICILFSSGRRWWYPLAALEKVSDHTPTGDPK